MTDRVEGDPRSGLPFTPARRDRGRRDRVPTSSTSGEEAFDEADLERGRSVALLGVLGRLQLRVDVLSRQQAEAMQGLQASLATIEQRLASLSETVEGLSQRNSVAPVVQRDQPEPGPTWTEAQA